MNNFLLYLPSPRVAASIVIVDIFFHLYIYYIQPLLFGRKTTLFNSFRDLYLSCIITSFFLLSLYPLFIYARSGLFLQILIQTILFLTIPLYNSTLKPYFFKLFNTKKSLVVYEEWLQTLGFEYKVFLLTQNITNAYATGFFKMGRTILIGKPLVTKLNEHELKSIILHEVGHHHKKHLRKLFWILVIISFCIATLFVILNKYIYPESPAVNGSLTYGLYGIIVYYSIAFQKRFEHEADVFASRIIGKEMYIDSLIKMNEINNFKMEKMSISHPTLKERIAHINENI